MPFEFGRGGGPAGIEIKYERCSHCGLCVLRFPGYIMQSSSKLRSRYQLPPKIQTGLALIAGYPAFRYQHGIRRRFARVQFYQN